MNDKEISSVDTFHEFEQAITNALSNRAKDWIEFSIKVLAHIEGYTIPQYGDKGEDQITNWSCEDCLKVVGKRLDRFGRNSREGQQQLDFLKMAHEVQLANDKYIEPPVAKFDKCTWLLLEEDGVDYGSACGKIFSIDYYPGTINYCLNCGKPLVIEESK